MYPGKAETPFVCFITFVRISLRDIFMLKWKRPRLDEVWMF